jgi:hypothetical protein
MHACLRCDHKFLTVSSLNYHTKTAKYCLKLEKNNTITPVSFVCIDCKKSFTQKSTLQNHKCPVSATVTRAIFRETVSEYKLKTEELSSVNSSQSQEIADLKLQLREIKGALGATKECFENVASKPTYTTNIAKQINGLEPLTNKDIEDSMEDLTFDILQQGGRSIGEWASNNLLKNKAICTDNSRKTFVWKGDDGKTFRDFKGTGLARKLFTYIHHTKSDELREWISTANDRLLKLMEEDPHSDETGLLKIKLERVCLVKTDCHNSSNGDPSSLCQTFINHIAGLLVKDCNEFIENVVTELLLEEGDIIVD